MTKPYRSGELKTNFRGQRMLKLYKRSIRLVELSNELFNLKLNRAFVLFDLIKTYRKLSKGVESGLYKFDDARDALKLIEEHVEDMNIERLIFKLRRMGVEVDAGMQAFCVSVGFLDDDVTRAVAREMTNKIRVCNRGDLSEEAVARDRRFRIV